jgi:hypothetical protein
MSATTWSMGTSLASVSCLFLYSMVRSRPRLLRDQAVGDADEIEIGEHDPGALAAVIDQDLDAGRLELRGEVLDRRDCQRFHYLVS